MNYKKLDLNNYYREKVYRHFSRDCKCSISMTSRIDVTELYKYSKLTNTKFYINFLYLLCKVLNSRDDYKMFYDWKKDEVYVYEVINPTQYVFSSTTETCTPVYTVYNSDYKTFYQNALADIEEAKKMGHISLTRKTILIGLMHHSYHGSVMIALMLSYLKVIYSSHRL